MTDDIRFSDLGLSPGICASLEKLGYDTPTPIQARAIPTALSGADLLGCAQTGTGKTAAFALPILQHLDEEKRNEHPRALVLTPTRELAQQVSEFFTRYGKNLSLRIVLVVGGAPMKRQIAELRRGVDVVVATPGRLLDLQGSRHVRLSEIEIVVLDEADRMLDMGFIPDVRRIMRSLPKERQTLLFSATMPPEIERLANEFLAEPTRIEVAPPSTPVDRIRQIIHPVDFVYKEALLDHLLATMETEQVLVFTRTKRAADFVTRILQGRGHDVEVIHGDLRQNLRDRALNNFRSKKIRALVATDVASRGLDIKDISHVINFDMPGTVEDYVHRIGRTARAEASGVAISFVEMGDWEIVRKIESECGIRIERVIVPGFEPKQGLFLAGIPETSPGTAAESGDDRIRIVPTRMRGKTRR